MKKALFIYLVLILSLLGCSQSVVQSEPVALDIPVEPLSNPTVISWSGENDWVFPAIGQIGKMYGGAIADTWGSDITNDIGFKYTKDSPLCISVYNSSTENATYRLFYYTEKYGTNHELHNSDGSILTTIALSKMFEDYIEVSEWHPIIPAKSVANIPVRISIPKGVILPKNWGIRIGVEAEGQGMFGTANVATFAISMR